MVAAPGANVTRQLLKLHGVPDSIHLWIELRAGQGFESPNIAYAPIPQKRMLIS